MNRNGYEIERYGHNYTGIYLEGQRQTMKDLRVAGLEAGVLNSGISEYEIGVLPTLSRHSALDRDSGSVRIPNL